MILSELKISESTSTLTVPWYQVFVLVSGPKTQDKICC